MDADSAQTETSPQHESVVADSSLADSSLAEAAVETGLPVIVPTQTEYRCPGESHSIPRSVHLSRLAAFYPACRECQHRSDTGQLPPKTVERIQQVERRVAQKQTVFLRNGIRGVFMNQLTPALAAQIARTFAAQLWRDLPLTGRVEGTAKPRAGRPGPAIVVGYDERPSSPSILAATIDSLRLMGCQIIDVGLVSRPCFCFSVDHLQSAGGLYVTGSGFDSSWTGLDLFLEGAIPLSLDTGLAEIEAGLSQQAARPTRSAGFQRSFQPQLPYEAGLWKHFHALRPLKVAAAVRPASVRKTLRKLFKKLPCQLFEVECESSPVSRLKLDAVREKTAERVHRRETHLGILIDDDGARCEFFDEAGNRVPQVALASFLADTVRSVVPKANIVIDQTISATPDEEGQEQGSSAGRVANAMLKSKAAMGVERGDRYWFRESFPACDAVLALARVLQGLSQSDVPFSARLG
ncbi:MAG: hypothetical protein H8E37_05930 [Planctomycetes bacterium]|nr:hypothetical protein [Planctomycetota bacterium]